MNLIRNGGFEKGNIDFWSVETSATLEISTLLPKYGSYCGKFISSGEYEEFIINNDYIDVNAHNILDMVGWIKSTAVRSARLLLYFYDSDYSYITYTYGIARTMDSTYMQLNSQFVLPVNTAYIRCGYYVEGSSVDEVFYLDGFNAHIIALESSLTGVINLLEYGRQTVDGNTSGDKMDLKQFSTYYADLQIGSVYGTTPTLDVSIYELDYRHQAVLLGSFTQATGAGRERIVLTNALGNSMYIVYTITGSSPEFYFRVDVTGKR